MEDKILLIIGNGINYSLKDYLNSDMRTDNFFSWQFVKYNIQEHFPRLYRELNENYVKDIQGDFQKIEKILIKAKNDLNIIKNEKMKIKQKYDLAEEKRNVIYFQKMEIKKQIDGIVRDILQRYNFNKFTQSEFNKLTSNEKENVINALYKLDELKKQQDEFDKQYRVIKDEYYKDYYDIEKDKKEYDINGIICEIQHYIVMAFSEYQNIVDGKNLGGWEWSSYIKHNSEKICGIVSLNYDLVIEKVLDDLNIKYYKVGAQKDNGGIMIFKPHGSIDYTIKGDITPTDYPMNNLVFMNNTPIECISRDRMLQGRLEVDIVPPTQFSEIKHFCWIREGYEAIKSLKNNIGEIIIGGVSYWECDREEINKIFDICTSNTIIYNINPDKESDNMSDLKKKIYEIIPKNNYICKGGINEIIFS